MKRTTQQAVDEWDGENIEDAEQTFDLGLAGTEVDLGVGDT